MGVYHIILYGQTVKDIVLSRNVQPQFLAAGGIIVGAGDRPQLQIFQVVQQSVLVGELALIPASVMKTIEVCDLIWFCGRGRKQQLLSGSGGVF